MLFLYIIFYYASYIIKFYYILLLNMYMYEGEGNIRGCSMMTGGPLGDSITSKMDSTFEQKWSINFQQKAFTPKPKLLFAKSSSTTLHDALIPALSLQRDFLTSRFAHRQYAPQPNIQSPFNLPQNSTQLKNYSPTRIKNTAFSSPNSPKTMVRNIMSNTVSPNLMETEKEYKMNKIGIKSKYSQLMKTTNKFWTPSGFSTPINESDMNQKAKIIPIKSINNFSQTKFPMAFSVTPQHKFNTFTIRKLPKRGITSFANTKKIFQKLKQCLNPEYVKNKAINTVIYIYIYML